jgi:hypothetical protein
MQHWWIDENGEYREDDFLAYGSAYGKDEE